MLSLIRTVKETVRRPTEGVRLFPLSLLTVDVASELNNGQGLPVFINMTCLTGLFSHPSEESLAEPLLWGTKRRCHRGNRPFQPDLT